MSQDATTLNVEIAALNQQLVGVSEHRSRLMVLLTERSREIADLTVELARATTEGRRHLEDAQCAARQLRRANEKLVEVTQGKHAIETTHSQLHDELESLRWELGTTKATATSAKRDLVSTHAELTRLHQELDAAKRTLEAEAGSWQQERDQLQMTLTGLSLEIRSEHQAARLLERRWTEAGARMELAHVAERGREVKELAPLDFRLARAEALEEEVIHLREECARMSAQLRELDRDAGASAELSRAQQELRSLMVDKQLLERKLEDAQSRDCEREELQQRLGEQAHLLQETAALKAEVERLRGRLYKTPVTSGTFPVGTRMDAIGQGQQAPRDLNSELAEFAAHADACSAVVADCLGFTVASVGSNDDCDSLAAVAGETDRLSSQASQILGLSAITQLTLEDRQGVVAHFRYFVIEDSVMSLGTLGSRIPPQDDLERIVALARETLGLARGRVERPPEQLNHPSGRVRLKHTVGKAGTKSLADLKAAIK